MKIIKSVSTLGSVNIVKLQDTMRNMSHSEEQAFSELIDNSCDAGANNINVYIERNRYIIADNGKGMNEQQLMNSCTFSSDTSEDSVIGRFGSGGTASTYRLANYKEILTKKDGLLLVAKQNLNATTENDMEVQFFEATDQHQEMFDKFCRGSKTGTCIILKDLRTDYSNYSRKGDLKRVLVKHFARIFRKLIDGSLQITINYDRKDTVINSFDPLFYNEPTKTLLDFVKEETFQVNGETVYVRMSALNSDAFAIREDYGPSLENQGLYFVRGDREISHRKNYGKLWGNHNSLNAMRVETKFPISLDHYFGTSVAKNSVDLKQEIVDKIKFIITPWGTEVKKHYQYKCASKNVELKLANETFNKNIIDKAASIGIPKKSSPNGIKAPRNHGDKKGTIEKKDTNITRSPKKVEWDMPTWAETVDPKNDKPYWFDEGVITINKSTKFIQELLINTDKKMQDYIRMQLITEYFCMRTYLIDTDEENIVSAYREKFSNMLVSIYKQIG